MIVRYRKHFTLPKEWDDGSAIWIYFEGTFRETTVWLNGVNLTTHISGYTSYAVRLDGAKFGADENVLALFIDPDTGRSGWWYEGERAPQLHGMMRCAASFALLPTSWQVAASTATCGSSARPPCTSRPRACSPTPTSPRRRRARRPH